MSTDLIADPYVSTRTDANLLEQDKDRPIFRALVNICALEVQRIRDVLQDIYESKFIDSATGAQLDALGWIVGEARQSRSDDEYRIFVRIRILANRSSGKIADSLKIARLLVGLSPSIDYIEDAPAGYIIDVANTDFDGATLKRILNLVRGAGIRLQVHTDPDTTNSFTLGSIADTSDAVHLGLSSTGTPLVGGILSSTV